MTSIGRLSLFVFLLAAPALAHAQTAAAIGDLRFIGQVTVPNDLTVDGTLVGGLSGLAYDGKTGLWYTISDDRSDKNPARFYVARLTYDAAAFAAVDIVRAITFLQSDGTPYPSREAGGDVPDPEGLSIDPQSGNIWWTSEGDRKLGLSPFVRVAGPDGHAVAALPTPDIFAMHKDEELGPRNNATFEGLSFAPDGKSVWIAMESALYQDGPLAGVDAGTVSRITRLDRDGKVLAQYAYPVDPIQAKPADGKNGDNGVSAFLALDDTHALVVERSGVEGADGVWKMYIRIYAIDTAGATDIGGIAALSGASYAPVDKRLVLDLSKHPEIGRVDNLEGVGFGPVLADGHRSLVLVSDNNFNPATQITQFVAFEVLP